MRCQEEDWRGATPPCCCLANCHWTIPGKRQNCRNSPRKLVICERNLDCTKIIKNWHIRCWCILKLKQICFKYKRFVFCSFLQYMTCLLTSIFLIGASTNIDCCLVGSVAPTHSMQTDLHWYRFLMETVLRTCALPCIQVVHAHIIQYNIHAYFGRVNCCDVAWCHPKKVA